ncbi:MAG: adventurous gliding motility protein AgmC, partial [Actinomycetota bacterium]
MRKSKTTRWLMTSLLLVQGIVFFSAPVAHAIPGAPDTTITSGPSGVVANNDAFFGFTATEASTFECRLQTTDPWTVCTEPATYTDLPDGAYNFEVRAKDTDEGLYDPTPAVRGFVVDTTAPETTIDDGPDPTVETAPVVFSFSSPDLDPDITFECQLDSGPFTGCSSPRDLGTMAEGPHTFSVVAIDGAGNVDPTPATQAFIYGIERPETTIDTGPPAAIGTTSTSFTFSSDDLGATFQCSLDGASFDNDNCTSPRNYTGLLEGSHSFAVRAKNAAGAVDLSPASRNFVVDLSEPGTTIDSAPAAVIAANEATFSFSSGEATATFECRLDSGVWDVCPSPTTLTGLAEGAHTFEVRAVDAAGNKDSSPASHAFSVDTTAPDTTIHNGPSGPTSSNSATFEFSSGDGSAAFDCRFDGGAWYVCTSPQVFPV